ncbi:histidine kinase [Paenibacillus baekrokdamisoli]|uniref:histidine kinase n=1 Tax=Paenibacillus baekrokdamisoli TaxID=1712516 RepID=A0A3G9J9X5_9BACL|nr:sensor histidine kinase [Paenibacillus baekrokdamisoli]MBB3069971.1 two-component system sensor histidine kinase YesM [Paenibacillus baekrokdamisoli]BBH20678.1 histidine kinase [Paenibacillus baekrokdamisoli]
MNRFVKGYETLTGPFRRSIRNKLILTMIILSVIPIITITAIAAENSRRSMEEEVIKTNVSNMKWTGIYLDEQFALLNNLIYTVLISPHLSSYLEKVEESSISSEFAAQRNIIDTLTNVFYSGGNHLVGVELYLKENNKLFTINSSQSDIKTTTAIPSPFDQLFEESKDFIIRTNGSDKSKFQLIRSINRFENREKLGGISLDIRWGLLDQTLNVLDRGEQQAVIIAGPDGNVLYQPNGPQLSDETKRMIKRLGRGQGLVRTANNYLFYNTIDSVGLTIVKVVPKSFINKSAQATMRYGFIVGAVSVLVSILIAIFFAWKTAKPIVKLARSMQGLNLIKEMEAPIITRIDEVGLLETKFHHMSHRIREHIKTEYSISLEKKTAELKALQAQINPHFLQNTLQMIGSMLFSKSPADIYTIIKSLSDMFRYVIREPDDLGSIQKEIDHLNNYMLIQQQRYSTRLHYTLEAQKEVLESPIPKLTLQPIVENAFFHGLDAKSGDWELDVTIAREGEDVLILIRDNGLGMEASRLAELQNRLESQSGQLWTHGNRIGLSNVSSRIRMHFGQEYGITVQSEPNQGTQVTIRIPFEARGEITQ